MLKKVATTFIARASNILVTLGIAVVISQALGAGGRGEQALILLGISLVCLFTQVAGGSALVYLTPRYDGKQLLRVAYLWIAGSSVLSFLILFGFNLLPQYGFHILILSILNSSWGVQAFYLLGREKNQWFNSLNFLSSFISLAYLFLKWKLLGLELADYVISLYLGYGITLIISLFGLKHLKSDKPVSSKKIFGKYIHHGGYIQLANVAQLLKYRIHFYLIELFLGAVPLGVYTNAVAVSEGIWLITRSLSLVQFSRVANLENDKEARKITTQYTWLSLGLSALGVLVLLLFPDAFFARIFGDEFHGLRELIGYLAVAICALSASNIISHYFSGIGRNHVNFIGSLIGLVITGILGYLLIPSQGLKGAAIASSVAFSATMVYHLLMYRYSRSVGK